MGSVLATLAALRRAPIFRAVALRDWNEYAALASIWVTFRDPIPERIVRLWAGADDEVAEGELKAIVAPHVPGTFFDIELPLADVACAPPAGALLTLALGKPEPVSKPATKAPSSAAEAKRQARYHARLRELAASGGLGIAIDDDEVIEILGRQLTEEGTRGRRSSSLYVQLVAGTDPWELVWAPTPESAPIIQAALAAYRDHTPAELARVLNEHGHRSLSARKPFARNTIEPVIIAVELMRGNEVGSP